MLALSGHKGQNYIKHIGAIEKGTVKSRCHCYLNLKFKTAIVLTLIESSKQPAMKLFKMETSLFFKTSWNRKNH